MPTPPDVTRRHFMETSTAFAALAGINSLVSSERVSGANDSVRVAICGVHGRGKDHLENYAKIKNVEIAALCDIDENVLRERLGANGQDGPEQSLRLSVTSANCWRTNRSTPSPSPRRTTGTR